MRDFYYVFAHATQYDGTKVCVVKERTLPQDWRTKADAQGWEMLADSAPDEKTGYSWAADGTLINAAGDEVFGSKEPCNGCYGYFPTSLYRAMRWVEGRTQRMRLMPFYGRLCDGCANGGSDSFTQVRPVKNIRS